MKFTVAEYIEWRKEWLSNPIGKKINTRRGECIVGPCFIIEDQCTEPFHLKNRELEQAEIDLIYHGEPMEEGWKNELYANDGELYWAYKSLNIQSLEDTKNRDSRNNTIFKKECCLCYWQLIGDTLFVLSRSWDIRVAGLSDIAVISNISNKLGCKKFIMYTTCNHDYIDRTTIARRK